MRASLKGLVLAVIAAAPGLAPVTANAGNTLLETRSYPPPYSGSSTETRQGDCSPLDVCTSSASADHGTGQTACSSEVAHAVPTSTVGTAWVDQQILVPPGSRRMSATSRWHLTGMSAGNGFAGAQATVRLQILDSSGAPPAFEADSFPHDFGLSVDAFSPARSVNQEFFMPTAWADARAEGEAPTRLTLRAILQCTAKTGGGLGGVSPGAASVDVVTGDQATRLRELVVNFYG